MRTSKDFVVCVNTITASRECGCDTCLYTDKMRSRSYTYGVSVATLDTQRKKKKLRSKAKQAATPTVKETLDRASGVLNALAEHDKGTS